MTPEIMTVLNELTAGTIDREAAIAALTGPDFPAGEVEQLVFVHLGGSDVIETDEQGRAWFVQGERRTRVGADGWPEEEG